MNVIRFVRNCDMRLLAGLFLIVAAIFARQFTVYQAAHQGPGMVRTIGTAQAECAARSVKTPFGKLGCADVRGVTEKGAAMFMSARK